MQRIDVACLYEHIARELDVACALKYLCADRHGMRVEIINWPHGLHEEVHRLRPAVVLLPFCYAERGYSYFESFLYWRQSIYINLAWEQIFYRGNLAAKTPRGEFARNHVLHHAWSDSFARYLQEQGIPPAHILVNGNPAYTLYTDPYRRYFKQRAELASEYGLDATIPWVFFPENYNWAFYSEGMLERFIQRGSDRDEVYGLKRFCESSLAEVMRWCSALAASGRVEVIVRPRPATPPEQFCNAVHEILPQIPSGMHLIHGDTVREWIMASDVVVSSHSTSLIEAAVAGKRAYMLEPYPIPDSLIMEWHALIPHLRTESEFAHSCTAPRSERHEGPLASWARESMMGHGDAIWNLAGFLSRLVKGDISHPPHPTLSSVMLPGPRGVPPWMLYQYRRAYWRIRKQGEARSQPAATREVVGREEIARRVARWGRVLAGYEGADCQPAAVVARSKNGEIPGE